MPGDMEVPFLTLMAGKSRKALLEETSGPSSPTGTHDMLLAKDASRTGQELHVSPPRQQPIFKDILPLNMAVLPGQG